MSNDLRNDLFYKSFMVSGLEGDYLEFGVYRGHSMIRAYKCAELIINEFLGNQWAAGDDPSVDQAAMQAHYRDLWEKRRFIAFDSFEGIPETDSAVDNFYKVFPAGSYACAQEQFLRNLRAAGVDLRKVLGARGFFDQTLTPETAEKLGLKEIAIAHIDSDLYESAKLALDFCTPYFRDGSIVIFDEWFQFRGNPYLGEQRAFAEWQSANPDWTVTDYHTQGPWSKAFILSRDPRI